MTVGRRAGAVGTAVTVLLAGASSALINELHGGWPWWVAAGGVVVISAVLSGWLAVRHAPGHTLNGAGSVTAGRNIKGPVSTTTIGVVTGGLPGAESSAGAVQAGRDIEGGVTTHTRFAPGSTTPPTASPR
jgi:hypothetical protein